MNYADDSQLYVLSSSSLCIGSASYFWLQESFICLPISWQKISLSRFLAYEGLLEHVGLCLGQCLVLFLLKHIAAVDDIYYIVYAVHDNIEL